MLNQSKSRLVTRSTGSGNPNNRGADHVTPTLFPTSRHLFQLSKMGAVTIKSLDHLVLTVRSIPDTIAFYTTHLGMKHEVFASALNPTVSRYKPP